MRLKPTKITRCFAVLDIGDEAYLTDQDPSAGLDSSDTDHLFREISEGVFYPVRNSKDINGKKIVGWFVGDENKEYILFYNDEFYTDMEWKSFEQRQENREVSDYPFWESVFNVIGLWLGKGGR